MKKSALLEERVILAPDYRAFLKESLELLRQKKRGFSLTTFAQSSGLGSRGFVLDVIQRKKRLTPRSAPKVIRGLGISGKLKSLFLLLVEDGEPDFSAAPAPAAERGKKIEKLRTQLLGELRREQNHDQVKSSTLYADINFLLVYSALGSLEVGASLGQVCLRTGLPSKAVQSVLERMAAEGIVREEGGSYRAINSHLVFEKLGDDQGFKAIFLETLKMVRDRASKEMKGEDRLFFHSAVPIEKSKLPELKAALKSALTDFVHDNQQDEGDHVAMLQLAFF